MSDSTTSTSSYRIDPLRGSDNYQVWKVKMLDILTDLSLDDYMEETAKEPSEADKKAAWKKNDRKALSTIRLRVADEVLVYISNSKSAKDAWSILRNMFEAKGPIGIVLARRKFFRAMCPEDGDVQEHIRTMRSYQAELTGLSQNITETDFSITLLTSLPDSWNPFISAIPEDTLTDSSKVISRILAEVARLNDRASQSTALASIDRSTARCYRCNQIGHLAADHDKPGFRPTQNPQRKERGNQRYDSNTNQRRRGPPRRGKSQQAHIAEEKREHSDSDDEDAFAAAAAVSSKVKLDPDDWLLDSGCSRSIVRNKSDFTCYTLSEHVINGFGAARGIGRGTVSLTFALGDRTRAGTLKNVIHCPDAPFNLISVGRLTDAGLRVDFVDNIVEIRSRHGTLLARGDEIAHMYRLRVRNKATISHAHLARTWDEWHLTLGHLNYSAIRELKRSGMVDGMEVDELRQSQQCTACIEGKDHVRSFPKKSQRSFTKIGEMVYTDLWGPARIKGPRGEHYFISFTDAYSAHSRLKFLKNKKGNTVFQAIKDYVAFIRKQAKHDVICFRFDNGKEYVNQEVLEWLDSEGINWELTAPYSSSQNGVAERLNRTLLSSARAMLLGAKLPFHLWPEAVEHACFIKNQAPVKALQHLQKTPHEMFWGEKPNVSGLQPFGAPIWVLNQSTNRHKLMPASRRFQFVGFSIHSRAYRYWNPGSTNVQTSRNVTFELPIRKDDDYYVVQAPDPPLLEGEKGPNEVNKQQESPTGAAEIPLPDSPLTTPPSSRSPSPNHDTAPQKAPRDISSKIDTSNIIEGKRTRGRAHIATDFAFISEAVECAMENDPTSLKEAMAAPDSAKFREAMQSEIDQLERLGTWVKVNLPPGRKAIPCRWVFRRKRNIEREIMKWKARLVAKGFLQVEGIDYNQTFAPTIRLETFRFLLALAARHKLKIHGMDVIAAYLNGELEEEVFMEQPPEFNDGTGRVLKLKLSLYGLKQSGRVWNIKLDSSFKALGFTRLLADQCVYVRRTSPNSSPVIVAVHVDDMTIMAASDEEIAQVKGELASHFDVTDLGELSHILGMEIVRDPTTGSIRLSQRNYALSILEQFGMRDCNPVQTPVDPNVKLEKLSEGDPKIGDESFRRHYLSGLGKLMYLAVATRPDIAHAVGYLAQFSQRPSDAHLTALKRVFRYLKGTLDFSLYFHSPDDLVVYCDADWAGDPSDRRSVSGYLTLYAGAAVSWSSRKQLTVALSTMEAEYMALAHTSREVIWLRQVANELGIDTSQPTTINIDNQSAIKFTENPVFHARSKHIDIRHHFVRERLISNEIRLIHCASEDNLADLLTKALPPPRFKSLRDRIFGRLAVTSRGSVGESTHTA